MKKAGIFLLIFIGLSMVIYSWAMLFYVVSKYNNSSIKITPKEKLK